MSATKPQHTPAWSFEGIFPSERNDSPCFAKISQDGPFCHTWAKVYAPDLEQAEKLAVMLAQAPALAEALQAIAGLSPACMSREAEEGFHYHTAENAHRIELCKLIHEAKEIARAALAAAGLNGGGK